MKKVEESNSCALCLSTKNNELKYGKLLTFKEITVHLFCLLFGPGLPQNGFESSDSIEGFLIPDIKKEIRRVKYLKCKYCGLSNANLGCCVVECPYTYHTSCGMKNNVVFEFTSKFESFCPKHKKIVQKDSKRLESKCGICYEGLSKKYPNAILMPCCENSWFHKICLQKYSFSAGVFFKCPLCGDKKCQEKLMKLGIFFPNKDADWELEEDAFEEFNHPLNLTCENQNCKEPKKNAEEYHEWKVCDFCGSKGVHYKCFTGAPNDKYTCTECENILKASKQKRPKSLAAVLFGESDCSSEDEDKVYTYIKFDP